MANCMIDLGNPGGFVALIGGGIGVARVLNLISRP